LLNKKFFENATLPGFPKKQDRIDRYMKIEEMYKELLLQYTS